MRKNFTCPALRVVGPPGGPTCPLPPLYKTNGHLAPRVLFLLKKNSLDSTSANSATAFARNMSTANRGNSSASACPVPRSRSVSGLRRRCGSELPADGWLFQDHTILDRPPGGHSTLWHTLLPEHPQSKAPNFSLLVLELHCLLTELEGAPGSVQPLSAISGTKSASDDRIFVSHFAGTRKQLSLDGFPIIVYFLCIRSVSRRSKGLENAQIQRSHHTITWVKLLKNIIFVVQR